MDIRHLRYFVVLAEELHFNHAAERLHIAQPALSQQVRNLERELQTELFARSTRRVELTLAGQALLNRARDILASIDAASDVVARVASGTSGRLSVGFTGSATYDLLPRIAKGVGEHMPGVSLEVHGEMATSDQIAALRSNSIDIGFLRPPIAVSEFSHKIVRTDYLSLMLPSTHRLAAERAIDLRDVASDPFIIYRPTADLATDAFVAGAYQQAGFKPIVRQEVNATSVMVSLVAAGMGLALVPDAVRSVCVDGAVIRPLRTPVVAMALAAAWRTANDVPAVQRFLEMLDAAAL